MPHTYTPNQYIKNIYIIYKATLHTHRDSQWAYSMNKTYFTLSNEIDNSLHVVKPSRSQPLPLDTQVIPILSYIFKL